MPDNPNTDSIVEQPWLDFDDWEIAFRPYEGNTDAALMLGVNLTILQSHIAQLGTINEAIGELEATLEAQIPTHEVSRCFLHPVLTISAGQTER